MSDDVSVNMRLGITVYLIGGILASVICVYISVVPYLFAYSDKVDQAVLQAYNNSLNGYNVGTEITGANAYTAIVSAYPYIKDVTIAVGHIDRNVDDNKIIMDIASTYYSQNLESAMNTDGTIFRNWKSIRDGAFESFNVDKLKSLYHTDISSYEQAEQYEYNTYYNENLETACRVLMQYASNKFEFNVVTDGNGLMSIDLNYVEVVVE